MNSTHELIIISVLTIALAITARLLLTWLIRSSRPAVRFRLMIGLFLLYTVAIILMLWQVYLFMIGMEATIEEYHKAVITSFCGINIAVIFIAVAYQVIRGKHRLSDTDRMKLMDMC